MNGRGSILGVQTALPGNVISSPSRMSRAAINIEASDEQRGDRSRSAGRRSANRADQGLWSKIHQRVESLERNRGETHVTRDRPCVDADQGRLVHTFQ